MERHFIYISIFSEPLSIDQDSIEFDSIRKNRVTVEWEHNDDTTYDDYTIDLEGEADHLHNEITAKSYTFRELTAGSRYTFTIITHSGIQLSETTKKSFTTGKYFYYLTLS